MSSPGHRSVRSASLVLVLYLLSLPAVHASGAALRRGPEHLQSIESAIQSANFSRTPISVVVRGIVTSSRHDIVIEDRTGAIEVHPLQPEQISLGDEVEVSGMISLSPEPQIEKAQLRRLWGGSMPLPLSITPDQAAEGGNELFLVETVAKLVDFAPAGLTGVRLNLIGGHQSFSAVLPSDSGEELSAKSMQSGTTLRLTGILVVNHGTSGGEPFAIQLRTPEDIELVELPSWWTRAHLLLVGAIAAILILAAISFVIHFRHARYRAVAEERASIARDLHDTLAQGYAGITLQLEAAQQMIQRDTGRAGALLNEALQLVRHSRDESHLSIDVLRSLSRDSRLEVLVSRCVQQFRAGCEGRIEQHVTGTPRVLSYSMVNNLFRIVQEALANAVSHSGAARIAVRVDYRNRGVLIEVEDDGAGFNPCSVAGPEEGHFGIVGMRERCASINARFELQSASSGTIVRVRADV